MPDHIRSAWFKTLGQLVAVLAVAVLLGWLLDHVWGGSVYVEERTIDVHIRRLRKTLEPHRLDPMVQTVRGAGYRFSAAA